MSKIGKQLIKMLKEDEWTRPRETSKVVRHTNSRFEFWISEQGVPKENVPGLAPDPVIPMNFIEKWQVKRLYGKILQGDSSKMYQRMFAPVNRLPGEEEEEEI